MSNRLLSLVSRLSIVDKNARVIPLKPNWAQRIYLDEYESQLDAHKPVRLINLKARQLGISTITEAIIYALSFVTPNSASMVIANEAENAHHLLGITNNYWETDPLKSFYETRFQAKNTLAWRGINSSVRTTTAGNKAAGRSRTINKLHASEVAFWKDAPIVMGGLLQAVPPTPMSLIALESTANGRGNYFHTTWKDAMAGNNEFAPLFFPWWMHYEYRASYIRLPVKPLGPLDPEEKALLELFRAGLTVGKYTFSLPPSEWEDALAWRRWAIWNQTQGDIIMFHQEYPSTPEEAFVATGTNVFPQQHLAKCFKQEPGKKGKLERVGVSVKFVLDPTGPLTIYRMPNPDIELGVYSMGGDSAATIKGDFAVAQVLNRRSFEQVAVWRGRITPAHFGEEMCKLGIFYNTALAAPENEGPGYATVGWMMSLDYPNMFQSTMVDGLPGRVVGKFGWSSSHRTKHLAISYILRFLIEGGMTIHDRPTYDEMDNYVTLESGGYGNGAGEDHDDTVMALAIALTASILDGPVAAPTGIAQNVPTHHEDSEWTVPTFETEPVWSNWQSQDDMVDSGAW